MKDTERPTQKLIKSATGDHATTVQKSGLMQIFIKNFLLIAQPLTHLTRKDTEFVFGTEEIASQEKLKAAIISYPSH
jgi:hypothetical protein